MQSQIVLVSDDSDFFEYIFSKLLLRKSDEIIRLSFDNVPEKLDLLSQAIFVINSENCEGCTISLLEILDYRPAIIFAYNNDEKFRIKVYKKGAFAFVTPITSDEELQAILLSALGFSSLLEKKLQYREMLVNKNLIKSTNEVILDYNSILDQELVRIQESSVPSVLVAISPDEKSKFKLQPNQIETVILTNIRKNDILMSYAANKYFLLLYDTDVDNAKKIWAKISSLIPERIYAGFAKTFSKNRQQLVNEALNKLHEAINYEKVYSNMLSNSADSGKKNFKQFRQDLNKKIEQVVIPVFYHIKQKYSEKLFGIVIEQKNEEGCSYLELKSRFAIARFKISAPGFANINIDITFSSSPNNIDAKRISLTPEELEAGLLEDLLEQFILEFKKEAENGTT